MNKEELRAVYRQIRLRMPKSEVSSKSRMISNKLLNDIAWADYKNVCVYQPIGELNEVDINGVISRLESQLKNVHVLSTVRNAKIPPRKFDLIIVPCLAFDRDNYRLGWGGGFYDKFLAGQPAAKKIGVGFRSGYTEQLPREPHDIPLDVIFSEV